MPLSVSQPVFGLESVETAVIPPWKIMKILSHRLKNSHNVCSQGPLRKSTLSSQPEHPHRWSESPIIVSAFLPKQKSEVKNLHNSLWSFTLRNLITAWYHPPLMACSSHNFLSNFFDSRFILFGSLTLSLVERSALPCARCQAGGEEAEEENQPEKETPVVNRTMDSC